MGSIPGSGKSPGGGHGNLLQYSYLENPTNRGAWHATVHRAADSDTSEATQQACILEIMEFYLACHQPAGKIVILNSQSSGSGSQEVINVCLFC